MNRELKTIADIKIIAVIVVVKIQIKQKQGSKNGKRSGL